MRYISPLNFQSLKTVSFFTLIFLLNCTSLIAQSNLTNDWKKELSKAQGQDRIDLIVTLSKDLSRENIIMADSLAREGIALANEMGDSLSMYKIGFILGNICTSLNKLDEGIEWAGKSLNYYDQDANLAFDKAKCQLLLASLYILKNSYSKADSLISESESFMKYTDDVLWQSKIPKTKGLLFLLKKEYEKSLRYYTEALEMSKHLNDINHTADLTRSIALSENILGRYSKALELQFQVVSMECGSVLKGKSYNDIGMIYYGLEDFKLARKYLIESIELKKRVGLESSLVYSYYNMGSINERLLNYGEALKYHKQALTLSKEYKLKQKTADILGGIGNIYGQLGEFEKSNHYYDQQLEMAIAKNDWEGIYLVNYNKGFFLHKAGQYDKAFKYLSISYQMAKEKERLPLLLKSTAMMANVHDALKEYEKSSSYADQWHIINDSINGLREMRKIGALEQKHQTELQKNSLNSADQSDTSSIKFKTYSSNIFAWVSIGLLILLSGFSFFFYKKSRKKEVAQVQIKSLDQTKLDNYFEELFTRLDQNKMALDTEKNQQPNTTPLPIYDMAGFLSANLKTSDDWASFEQYFEKVHKDFFKNLKSTCPSISPNELNMCALIKLNLRNKDIAKVMGISPESVRKALNRLSKKMEIPTNDTLRGFVLKI